MQWACGFNDVLNKCDSAASLGKSGGWEGRWLTCECSKGNVDCKVVRHLGHWSPAQTQSLPVHGVLCGTGWCVWGAACPLRKRALRSHGPTGKPLCGKYAQTACGILWRWKFGIADQDLDSSEWIWMDLSRTGQPNPSPVLDSLCASKRMAAFCQAQVHLSKSQPNRFEIHRFHTSRYIKHVTKPYQTYPCRVALCQAPAGLGATIWGWGWGRVPIFPVMNSNDQKDPKKNHHRPQHAPKYIHVPWAFYIARCSSPVVLHRSNCWLTGRLNMIEPSWTRKLPAHENMQSWSILLFFAQHSLWAEELVNELAISNFSAHHDMRRDLFTT